MSADKAPHYEFNASEVADLLAQLDQRLQRRGVAASVFVVGGAAIAAAGVRSDRLTEDIDAIAQDAVVLAEASALAEERGLPENWLNPNARMWMPPLPDGVLDRPTRPGLRVTYADNGFLFATKLVAQRTKDADDLVALAERLGMQRADADELEAQFGAITPTAQPWSSSSMATTWTENCAFSPRMQQAYSGDTGTGSQP